MRTCTRSRFSRSGNTLYVGNDGGAYVTTQITATDPSFTALNSTLGITQFYPGLSIHPTNAGVAIGGTQDNGTVIYSGALTWNDVVCGDGGYTAIDFVTPRHHVRRVSAVQYFQVHIERSVWKLELAVKWNQYRRPGGLHSSAGDGSIEFANALFRNQPRVPDYEWRLELDRHFSRPHRG